jgi:DNA-binding MarR family transcriptional regulator
MSPTSFDDARLTAMGLLVEVHCALTSRIDEVLRRHRVSGSDFDVLIRLARSRQQALRLTDLAAQTNMSTSGITRVIDRLEREGLARRKACDNDRRAYLVRLTDAGEHRMERLVPEVGDTIEHWFTGVVPPDQLDNFLATLREVRDAANPGAFAGAYPQPAAPRPVREPSRQPGHPPDPDTPAHQA